MIRNYFKMFSIQIIFKIFCRPKYTKKVQVHLRYNIHCKNLKTETQMQLVSTHLQLTVQELLPSRIETHHILRVFRVAGYSDYLQLRLRCDS